MQTTDANEWGERARPPLSVRFPELAGKSVLITGGASGIGAAVAEGFVMQGARVAILDKLRSHELCDMLAERYGSRPYGLCCDVTDTPALRSAIAAAASENGGVDVLINCAANDQRHGTGEVTEEFWNWSMGVNLKAYFFAAQAVLDDMVNAGSGVIINFSSVAYMMGMAGFPCYTAANAGIVSLTHSLAREFGNRGVRVNAIAPGMVLTPRQKDLWLTPEAVAEHVRNQCLDEPLLPDDLVGPALFLASDASRMMTGQTLVVDGGLIARA